MGYYKDLREYLKVLEGKGKLVRITREINKDTELHPLVRLQFRGLPEEERKAFLFENVVDSRGRKYSIPVAVCAIAPSIEVYAIGMNCKPDEITKRWEEAQLHPIEPKIIGSGPVQEEVHMGNGLLEHGGLEEFPIPISTPGYDAGPFITSPYWVSKDPETGIANVGTYRAHVKSPTRTGIMCSTWAKDIIRHRIKCRERGIPLQAAIVVGASPNIGYVSVARLPYDVNEFAVAGGIAGEPVELVRCKTVDLEVPAYAEIVIEGELSMDEVEPEAPFGEALGYMGDRDMMPYFTVKCITHRKNAIWQAFLSQFPPSESSKLRGISRENIIYKYLKYDQNIPGVVQVAILEAAASCGFMVIKMQRVEQSEVWRALEAVSKWLPDNVPHMKVIVAVDEDIDPWDADALNWAIFSRVQPHRDCRIITFAPKGTMDQSLLSPEEGLLDVHYKDLPEASHMLMNATMKWPYLPISLPKREFMERALQIWKEENLPPLKLKQPWWGYNLGHWPAEEDEHAMMAVRGEYERVGDILAQRRRKED